MKNPIKESPCSCESLDCFSTLKYGSYFYVVGLLVYMHSTLRVEMCTDRLAKFTDSFMIFFCHSKQMLR